MTQRPRSVVMDLFGEYLRFAGGSVQPAELITLLSVFGVEPATTRVTVSRMKRDGWFTAGREGRAAIYQLTPTMEQVLMDGRRRIFSHTQEPWSGRWTQVMYQVPEPARAVREALRKKLTWLGFGQFASSVWLSPHDDMAAMRQLRVEFEDASIDVLQVSGTSLTTDAEIVQRCWDLAGLADDYRSFLATFGPWDRGERGALHELDGADALRLRTAVVSAWRRLSFDDPRLPPELLPADWPGADAFATFRSVHAQLESAATGYVESVIGRDVRIEDEADVTVS